MNTETDIPAPKSKPARKLSALWKIGIAFTVLALLAAIGWGARYWYLNLQTYHLATVAPNILYRDGNRNMREFKHALTSTQARTVVSLVDDTEFNDPAKPQFAEESNYCTARLIQYIRIPVPLGGWPSSQDIRDFLRTVQNTGNQPVLVHCAQGVRRTGMFVAAYQMSVLHEPKEQVMAEIKPFGHKAKDMDDVREFIKEYDPVKQTLPVKKRAHTSE